MMIAEKQTALILVYSCASNRQPGETLHITHQRLIT